MPLTTRAGWGSPISSQPTKAGPYVSMPPSAIWEDVRSLPVRREMCAPEDVAHLFGELGIVIGVDLVSLLTLARLLPTLVDHNVAGQVMKAGRSCDLHPVAPWANYLEPTILSCEFPKTETVASQFLSLRLPFSPNDSAHELPAMTQANDNLLDRHATLRQCENRGISVASTRNQTFVPGTASC
jgi:hypothetical protein